MEGYINVDQLFRCETCYHHVNGKCNTFCDIGESYRPAFSKLKVIDNVQEVKYAHWVLTPLKKHPNEFSIKCSLCGESVLAMYNYCHGCGATIIKRGMRSEIV